MSNQTAPKQEQPYIPVGTVVSYPDKGKVAIGRIVSGTDNSVQIEEIVPITEGNRPPVTKEFAKWEFTAPKHRVHDDWTAAAGRGLDLRRAVEEAQRGLPDSEILRGYNDLRDLNNGVTKAQTSDNDPGDEHRDDGVDVSLKDGVLDVADQGEAAPAAQDPEPAVEKAPEPADEAVPEPAAAEESQAQPTKGSVRKRK